MSRVKSKDTAAELVVRRLLHSMGYRYRLHRKNLPGSPDVVFASRRKVILVHGCFWHQHEGCPRANPPKSNLDYWEPKLRKDVIRDQEAAGQLRDLGWESMTVWECEMGESDMLAERFAQFLDRRAPKGSRE